MLQTTAEITQNTASVKRTVSKATESAITAKCQLIDLFDNLVRTMVLIYGEESSDKRSDEIYEHLKSINEYVDKTIIDSIFSNIVVLDCTEF